MEGNAVSFIIVSYVKRYWIYVILGIFAINFIVADYYLFTSRSQPAQAPVADNINVASVSQNSCPQSCVDKINLVAGPQKGSVIVTTPNPIATATSAFLVVPTATPTTVATKSVKEFFIPLGVGNGNAADWTVINGIGAKIDPVDYGDIKTVTFEVSARIPTGNQTIWIRLYNANTYQSVVSSELTLSGGTPTLLVSSPITLSSGNNLYQIQMKTQLQYTANIDMARIRIKTN